MFDEQVSCSPDPKHPIQFWNDNSWIFTNSLTGQIAFFDENSNKKRKRQTGIVKYILIGQINRENSNLRIILELEVGSGEQYKDYDVRKKNDTCKFASFNHHSFFADMWWIAVCITKSDSRDPTATRKYFRIQRISQVYWSDVMREIFDQKAGFNSEAKLFGIGVGFTSG